MRRFSEWRHWLRLPRLPHVGRLRLSHDLGGFNRDELVQTSPSSKTFIWLWVKKKSPKKITAFGWFSIGFFWCFFAILFFDPKPYMNLWPYLGFFPRHLQHPTTPPKGLIPHNHRLILRTSKTAFASRLDQRKLQKPKAQRDRKRKSKPGTMRQHRFNDLWIYNTKLERPKTQTQRLSHLKTTTRRRRTSLSLSQTTGWRWVAMNSEEGKGKKTGGWRSR